MAERKTLLFDKAGPAQTGPTLKAVRDRAVELGIKTVVLATTTGDTALKALDALEGTGVRVIGVTLQAGTWAQYDPPDPEKVKAATARGAQILTSTHTLMGNVETAIREKFGGVPPVELIAHTYYTFGQGMKVAVEVALMAADAGLVPTNKEVLALGGAGKGADTALVVTPKCSAEFFDLRIHEIVAMPRRGRK